MNATNYQKPLIVIRPRSGWAAIDLRELWEYRDLLFILIGRDVKLRYKQTALGVAWVVLQPLLAALIFTVVFGRYAKMPSDGLPYLLFVFTGLVVWNFFSGAIQRASNSLITNNQLVTKIYFPRLLIPLAHTLSVLVDAAVMLLVLAGLMVFYRYTPPLQLLALPLVFVLACLCATGVSLWLSALSVEYRDFVYVVPFLIQVWMFATPVVYAASIFPEHLIHYFAFNPAMGFVEGARWAVLGKGLVQGPVIVISTVISLMLFFSGAIFFRRAERRFADII
ncbi:ABC transporter permease [bacterium]|nr:ABC transporter permease [bacterium]